MIGGLRIWLFFKISTLDTYNKARTKPGGKMADLINTLKEFGPLGLISLAITYVLLKRNIVIKIGDKDDDNCKNGT
jgi:hypothetical protein